MIGNTPSAKEKTKALDLALQQIEKQFGKGSIMKLGEESARVAVEVIPTGSIGLDLALGVGGVPRGRIVEIYGPESSGKTTLALTIIANAQRLGGNAVFIDAEHALDAAYAQKLGVDITNLHVAQPDTGEEALEIADHLVRSGAVDVTSISGTALPSPSFMMAPLPNCFSICCRARSSARVFSLADGVVFSMICVSFAGA